jgi:murein L,D-transpeptidase YcbB/YkuD
MTQDRFFHIHRDLRSISWELLVCSLLTMVPGQLLAQPPVEPAEPVLRSGQAELPLAPTTVSPGLVSDLERIYAERQGELIWHQDGRINGRVALLAQAIAQVEAEGLDPDHYHLPELVPDTSVSPPQERLEREHRLTTLYLRLARDLHSGEFKPTLIDPNWYLPVEPFDPDAALRLLLQQTDPIDLIHALTPRSRAYRRLRWALHDYRRLASRGGWPELPDFPTLRPGESHSGVPLLRRRLQLEGDHPNLAALQADTYDETLEAAVRRFQTRNGLVEDGVVGAKTLAALNVPIDERIYQIRANMERWRWLPRDLGSQYLLVNTGGYELTLFIDGQPVLRKRTINGTRKRQTPSFASRITHLVVNPRWTVPRIIAVKDLLPRQQRDVEYLSQMGIQVLGFAEGEWVQLDPMSIDWRQYHKNNFPFTLRQVPGDKNSLGRIKFLMHNPYAIYLHDTPAKGLFEKPIRAFSSGCIRVQGVEQLARRLLLIGGQSPAETLDEPLQSLQTRTQRLARPVPVYLVYFTSWVDDEGLVHFRPDVYRRNNGLMMALSSEGAKVTAVNYRDSDNPF